jgi:hypothetical protein
VVSLEDTIDQVRRTPPNCKKKSAEYDISPPRSTAVLNE